MRDFFGRDNFNFVDGELLMLLKNRTCLAAVSDMWMMLIDNLRSFNVSGVSQT